LIIISGLLLTKLLPLYLISLRVTIIIFIIIRFFSAVHFFIIVNKFITIWLIYLLIIIPILIQIVLNIIIIVIFIGSLRLLRPTSFVSFAFHWRLKELLVLVLFIHRPLLRIGVISWQVLKREFNFSNISSKIKTFLKSFLGICMLLSVFVAIIWF
jgi:hypothetical protein